MIRKGLPNFIKSIFKYSTTDPSRLSLIRNHTPLILELFKICIVSTTHKCVVKKK